MKRTLRRLHSKGFTVIELIVVIAVIGILAAVVIVAYRGITASATDKTVQTDLDELEGLETRCGLHPSQCGLSGVAAVAWYSGTGTNSYLQFTPNTGNVIDVVANSSDYCIRAYNPNAATYKTLATAATKESTPGVCATLTASTAAMIDSGAPPTYSTSFETAFDGWSSGAGSNVVTLSTAMAHTGAQSVKSVQNTFWYTNDAVHCGSPTASCGFPGDGLRNTLTSLTIGHAYTIWAWVYTDDTAYPRSVFWNAITGGTLSSATPVTLTPHSWNKVQATLTATATSSYIYLYIQSSSNPPTDTVTTYIDDITLF